jgi:hypothetical protein
MTDTHVKVTKTGRTIMPEQVKYKPGVTEQMVEDAYQAAVNGGDAELEAYYTLFEQIPGG